MRCWLPLRHAVTEGLAFVVGHLGLQTVRKSPPALICKGPWRTNSQEQTGNSFPTADRLTQISWDWNVHWRHSRKNPLRIPALHMTHLLEFPCDSQLCTWMELSFVCVFIIGWTFAANGTCPAECWLLGSPCFFVNLNGGGRGNIPPIRSQTSARWMARRGRLVESWLWTSFPLVCAVLWIPLLPLPTRFWVGCWLANSFLPT